MDAVIKNMMIDHANPSGLSFIFVYVFLFSLKSIRPTVCVSRKWVGRDSACEQYKPEVRKMLISRADSHLSAARCVGRSYSFNHKDQRYIDKTNTHNK
jgi:hypothetical protein